MPKYVIEGDIPGAGKLSPAELQSISQRSCAVLERLGPKIQWVQSNVTDDKIYCIYVAPAEEVVREHAVEPHLAGADDHRPDFRITSLQDQRVRP
jgi:hypothetical protein